MPTNSTRPRPVRLIAAGAASLLVLAACGGGDEGPATVVPPPAAPPVTVAETPSGAPLAGASPSATASPSESPTSTAEEGTVIELNLVGGKADPPQQLNQQFAKGDTVTIAVTTDKAYEVHVHGYDYTLKAVPGETIRTTFVLDKSGSYEVEIEETHKLLFNLQVR